MFIAYVIQEGEGCDYTIGCAQTLWRLRAKTRDAALEELRLCIGGEDGYFIDHKLKEVTLFEVVSEEKAPVAMWYEQFAAIVESQKAHSADLAERAEFERLKRKYGA